LRKCVSAKQTNLYPKNPTIKSKPIKSKQILQIPVTLSSLKDAHAKVMTKVGEWEAERKKRIEEGAKGVQTEEAAAEEPAQV
jgi:hypothetical protein